MSARNVLVLGMDDLNRQSLEDLPEAKDGTVRFHPLLTADELVEVEQPDMAGLLDKAQKQVEDFDGPVHAIVGYWDFPVSSMVPILCRRFGLPGPDLRAVVACEHKYWSRVEQAKVTDAHPRFALVDLDGSAEPPDDVPFPMWLKPIKSASSQLAFRVEDEQQFADAVEQIRDGVDAFGAPFEFVLERLGDLPPEIAEVGGSACLAEEAAEGQQVTVEGYSFGGRARAYGIIDSPTYPDSSSFLRYQYPANLPESVAQHLEDVSRRVIEQIGLDGWPFNIEFFWDPDSDDISLLEVNPRHSQSHALLFERVDGFPNHQAMVRLGLGQDPDLPHRQGACSVAAKWFLRRFSDGFVRRVPTDEELRAVEREVPGVTVDVVAQEGCRLSDLGHQDSYSYELADIFVAADDETDLVRRYERCVDALRFEIDD